MTPRLKAVMPCVHSSRAKVSLSSMVEDVFFFRGLHCQDCSFDDQTIDSSSMAVTFKGPMLTSIPDGVKLLWETYHGVASNLLIFLRLQNNEPVILVPQILFL